MCRCLVILVCAAAVTGVMVLPAAWGGDEARRKIAELEKKLAALPAGQFDWTLHNELRHWYGAVDERKSMGHCDVIFKHSRMDDYMMQVLGGKDADRTTALKAMAAHATKYADLPHLAAAC